MFRFIIIDEKFILINAEIILFLNQIAQKILKIKESLL